MTVDPHTQDASSADRAALEALQDYRAGALPRIQKRAANWIAGLVAITGVVTTAVVIKGPDSIEGLTEARRTLIIALIVAGGLFIANGIYRAYSAAYGDPLDDDRLEERAEKHIVLDAAKDWHEATSNAATAARDELKRAMWSTVLGTASLATAILVTWISPTPDAEKTFTCFQSGTDTVTIEGSAPVVTKGRLTIVPCTS